ncbi:D-alanine--D-alanine ligase family protein [Mesorhizobium sp. LHD-90]|uniref:D-alanine--D-alanine ligase family protein n=1 Tax=Mesorhizobium sp. LHD-90 TaxID=3071414 RepID=UPI0027DF0B3B|nr:D-alanine--D-alanine ligase family protein [Mesorhizobium sp. LHD-90]MDQ6438034.1 D-alanine--D-alanine ligase family protein [Mesorhizobium sp. LHD-90]
MSEKLRVALLFGGRSSEHDVSIMSATNVFGALDPARYDVFPIGVSRAGEWIFCAPGAMPAAVPETGPRVALLPGGRGRLATLAAPGETAPELPAIDLVFPVLHGPFGEDGTVQGAVALADVPCVGPGVLASAAAMDKEIAKRLLVGEGLAVARWRTVIAGEPLPTFDELTAELGRPLFVKPARQGSSVGVTKVETADELEPAIRNALKHDWKVLIEEFMRGREVECGVLENEDGSLLASVPGEIVPTNRHAFYSYEAKYLDKDGADLRVPADLPPGVSDKLRALSQRAFRALGCEGMTRVDFFLTEDSELIVNELNTIPGFTNISMYPKMLDATGVPYPELVDRLIRHAIQRFSRGI